MSTTYANPTNPSITADPSGVTLKFHANITVTGGYELFKKYAEITSGAPAVTIDTAATPVAEYHAPLPQLATLAPPPVRHAMVGSWADDAEARDQAAAEAAKTPKNWNDVAKKGITLPALVGNDQAERGSTPAVRGSAPRQYPPRSKEAPGVCTEDECWPPITKKIGRALHNGVHPKILADHGVMIPKRITERGQEACGKYHPVKNAGKIVTTPTTTRLCTNGAASGAWRCTKDGCTYSHVPESIYLTWRWCASPAADADARKFWGDDISVVETALADLFTWSLPDTEPSAVAPTAPPPAAPASVPADAPADASRVHKPRAVRVPKDGTWSNPAVVVEQPKPVAEQPAEPSAEEPAPKRPNGRKRAAAAAAAAGKPVTPVRVISPITKAGLDDLDVAAEARLVVA